MQRDEVVNYQLPLSVHDSLDSWQQLGSANFRKWTVYEQQWKITGTEIEQAHIACAPDSGPVVLFQKQELKVVDQPNSSGDGTISKLVVTGATHRRGDAHSNQAGRLHGAGRIYSMSGILRTVLPLDLSPIAPGGIGWISQHLVVVVYINGTVSSFDVSGEEVRYSLIKADFQIGTVALAHVFGSGVFLLMSTGKLYVLTEIRSNWKLRCWNGGLQLSSATAQVTTLTARDPTRLTDADSSRPGRDDGLSVFLGFSDGSVVSLDSESACASPVAGLCNSSVLKLSFASSGQLVAAYCANGELVVLDRGLGKRVLVFDTKATAVPLDMVWCGADAVVLHWRELGLLMVGPFGNWVRYAYSGPLFLAQEVDSCRVFSGRYSEIIQRVPVHVEAVLVPGSVAPGAVLCASMEDMALGRPRADDGVRSLLLSGEGTVLEAVEQCMSAALEEFDIRIQQQFLRVAALGKGFCVSELGRQRCAQLFTRTCATLRALNALRHTTIGMPLTVRQFDHLSPYGVLSRLMLQKEFYFALKLSNYLRIPAVKQRIVAAWAKEKIHAMYKGVQQMRGNEVLAIDKAMLRSIQDRMSECHQADFVPVALEAEAFGRRHLAMMLLELECKSYLQVAHLLQLAEYDVATKKAVELGDTNLVLYCLFKSSNAAELPASVHRVAKGRAFQESRKTDFPVEHFYRLLGRYPIARNRWIGHLKTLVLSERIFRKGSLNPFESAVVPLPLHVAPERGAWSKVRSYLKRYTSSANESEVKNVVERKNEKPREESLNPFANMVPSSNPSPQEASTNGTCSAQDLLVASFEALNLVKEHGSWIADSASWEHSCKEKHHVLAKACKVFAKSNDCDFHYAITSDHMRLLRHQQMLEMGSGTEGKLLGKSLADTILHCLMLDDYEKADALKREFHFSELAFTNLRVQSLLSCKDWVGLEAIVKDKYSRANLEDVAKQCLREGQVDLCARITSQIPDPEVQVEIFMSAELWNDAIRVATASGDVDSLLQISRRKDLPDSITHRAISAINAG